MQAIHIGLISQANLDWADVMIWWRHVRHWEISTETVKRKLMKRLESILWR